ncbi:MAG: hypothetical protein AAF725_16655, partial [Acidobacteriota bacterium]
SPTAVPHISGREDFPLKGLLRSSEGALTASYSKSSSGRKYAYYHEPAGHEASGGKSKIRIPRERMHDLFLELLRSLRPSERFLTAWKAALLVEWERRVADIRASAQSYATRVRDLTEQKERLLDLLLEGVIDPGTFKARERRIDADLVIAEAQSAEGREPTLDAESAIEKGGQLIMRADRLWLDAGYENRQRIQQMLFPEGLEVTRNRDLRTPVTRCIFRPLVSKAQSEIRMVRQCSGSSNLASDLRLVFE